MEKRPPFTAERTLVFHQLCCPNCVRMLRMPERAKHPPYPTVDLTCECGWEGVGTFFTRQEPTDV